MLKCGSRLADSDIQRRVLLVNDCGKVLERKRTNTFTQLYELCGHRIASGTNNLLSVLGDFKAFDDPVRKKSLYLLGLNATTCGWEYEDLDFLDPPVDYHEVRGHLRLGTVQVNDETLGQLIRSGRSVDRAADLAIRSAVTRAIRRVSDLSGFSPMQLHYAFWNLFRAVCVRGQPICRGRIQHRLPPAYQSLIVNDSCIFVNCCDSAGLETAVDEHQFKTEWY
jgi:hypothetical protein